MSREELERKTIIELKEIAKEEGVARYSMLSKAELIDALVDEENEFEEAVLDEAEEVTPVEELDEEVDLDENVEQISFIISTTVTDHEVTYPANTPLSQVLDDCRIPRSHTIVVAGEMLSFNALTRSIGSLGIYNGQQVMAATKVANA